MAFRPSHPLTSRERLRRCYNHQEQDRPGVYIRTYWPSNDPSYDPVKAYVKEHTDLKIPVDLQGLETAPRVTSHREPYSDDFAREIAIVHTPRGDVRASWLIGLRLLPGYCEEHFIKSVEDAEKWLSLPLPEPVGDANRFHAAEKEVGDRGIVDGCLGNCAGGFVADLFGSEAFAIFSITNRDLIHALCQRQQQIILNRVKRALSLGIGPYFSILGQEMIVPPLHGPADFADFCTHYDRPIYDLIHEAGGRIHVHCHSRIGQVFQSFVDSGVDVLHPFEAPPMGDITAKDAKRLARGRMCLEGNIQIADMYEQTTRQITEQTAALIADVFDDQRDLIVSPSASLYQQGKGAQCLEQVKAMVQTVLK